MTPTSIASLYGRGRPVLSFEVFPPKKNEETDVRAMYMVLDRLAALAPDFISVTYGAGGSATAKRRTAEIAGHIQGLGIPALAHLTCIGQDDAGIRTSLSDLTGRGVGNVLALRGDLPEGAIEPSGYRHATDLIRAVRNHTAGMSIGAACYPEGHIDESDFNLSLMRAKEKQSAGANFLIAQLCFDNGLFYRFLDRAKAEGITLPVSAGVMPILSRSQIERMIFMCGASLPARIIKLLHKHEHSPSDLRKAGIDMAADQVYDLARNGADGIHIYTMNHPDIAQACAAAVRR